MAQKTFGRPRLFPQHADHHQFQFQPDADREVMAEMTANGSPVVREWLSEHQDDLIPNKVVLYHRAQANYNDPRVTYYVLDAMVKSKPWTYLRPGQVADWLNASHPQYYWSGIAVGRILAGVYDAALNAYALYEMDSRDLPVTQGRDSISRYYIIDPRGGNEGRLWLMGARRVMYKIAVDQQQYDNIGQQEKLFGVGRSAGAQFSGDINDAYVMEPWLADVGPVRDSLDAIEAQYKAPSGSRLPEVPVEVPVPQFGSAPQDGSGVVLRR